MNILIAINSTYIQHVKVMLYSLAVHNKEYLDIYLLHSELKKNELRELEKFISKLCHGTLHSILLEGHLCEKFPLRGHFSKETYYRIYAQYLLPENMERILWLDADIVIRRSILDFYEKDFEGNCLIACENENAEEQNNAKRLGLSCDKYFNAGVILMNLIEMRKKISREELECLVDDNLPLLLWQDQDVLNIAYQDCTLFSDKKFNYQVGKEKNSLKAVENAAVLHYVGAKKPWCYYYMDEERKYYLSYLKKVSLGRYFRLVLLAQIYKSVKSGKQVFLWY